MQDVVVATEWLAIAGICICILRGYRQWALLYLIAPAVLLLTLEYIVGPLLMPLWPPSSATARQDWWLIVLVLVAAPLIAAILGLRLLTATFTFLFGARAAGHLGGAVLVRWFLRRRSGRSIPKVEDGDD